MQEKFSSKTKFILGLFILSSLLLSPFKVSATDRNDAVFKQIEELKDSPLFYSQNVSDMQELQGFIASNIYNLEKLVKKGQEESEYDNKKISDLQKEMKSKKKTKDKLLKRVYIEGTFSKGIFAFLGFDRLTDLISQEVYGKKTYISAVEQIRKIEKERATIEDEISKTRARGKNLENQIAFLELQLEEVKSAIIDSNTKEKDNQYNEQNIINTDTQIVPLNNRDFITWNKVDFEKQDSIRFIGSGTAHGVGMSQYGAKAMAESGSDFESILRHYYKGTVIRNIDTENQIVRVKISAGNRGKIKVKNGTATALKSDGKEVEMKAGELIDSEEGLRVVPTNQNTILELDYKNDSFNKYRGVIETKSIPGEGFVTINYIYLEDYLKGVVPGEMSASWALEALKAQAVTARNYVYKSINLTKNYDICDTPACQVYLGASHEQTSSNQAVESTRGMVIYYNNEIITAYYFSSSGGWTEDNENVWSGTPRPYLRGVESPGEKSPYNQWGTDTLSKETVQSYLNNNSKTAVGDIKSIEIIKRGVSGRVMAVKITGSDGERVVTGYTFKTAINLGLPDGESDYIRDVLFGIK